MKKYLTRPMALALSLTVLCGAMAAAALTGSPYEMVKDALFNTATAPSYAAEIEVSLSVNGVVREQNSHSSVVSETGSVSYSDGGFEKYMGNGLSIYPVYRTDENGGTAAVSYRASRYQGGTGNSSLLGIELSRTQPEVRLAEMLLDILTGDIKDSISMSSKDGGKALSLTLTGAQIPEMYQLGLTVLMTQEMNVRYYVSEQREITRDADSVTTESVYISNGMKTTRRYKETFTRMYFDPVTGEKSDKYDPDAEYYDEYTDYTLISETSVPVTKEDYGEDLLDHPMKEAKIEYVSLSGQIGSDGFIRDYDGLIRVTLVTVFGDIAEIEIKINGSMKDVGAAAAECPIPGAEEVLTAELFESFGYSDGFNGGLYFSLNEDGTINESSIRADLSMFAASAPVYK